MNLRNAVARVLGFSLILSVAVDLVDAPAHAQRPAGAVTTIATERGGAYFGSSGVSENGNVVAYVREALNSSLWVWNRRTGSRVKIASSVSTNQAVHLSANGRYVSYLVAGSRRVIRWDSKTRKSRTVAKTTAEVFNVSSTGRFYIYTTSRRQVVIKDIVTGSITPLDSTYYTYAGMAVSADGKTAAYFTSPIPTLTGAPGETWCQVTVYHSTSGSWSPVVVPGSREGLCSNDYPQIIVSDDGNSVTFMADGDGPSIDDDPWFRYDVTTGKVRSMYPRAGKSCSRPSYAEVFSPNGEYVAYQRVGCHGGIVGNYHAAHLWNLRTGQRTTLPYARMSGLRNELGVGSVSNRGAVVFQNGFQRAVTSPYQLTELMVT